MSRQTNTGEPYITWMPLQNLLMVFPSGGNPGRTGFGQYRYFRPYFGAFVATPESIAYRDAVLAGQQSATSYQRPVTLFGDMYDKIVEPLTRETEEHKQLRRAARASSNDWTSSLFLLVHPSGLMQFKRDKAHGSTWKQRLEAAKSYGFNVIAYKVWEHQTEQEALDSERKLHDALISAGCVQRADEVYEVTW